MDHRMERKKAITRAMAELEIARHTYLEETGQTKDLDIIFDKLKAFKTEYIDLYRDHKEVVEAKIVADKIQGGVIESHKLNPTAWDPTADPLGWMQDEAARFMKNNPKKKDD